MLMFIRINLSVVSLCLFGGTNFISGDEPNRNDRNILAFLEENDGESSSHVPEDNWTANAIKNIAYYLRCYKFNEWDYRYYLDQVSENKIGSFATFPIPRLRSLHWEVKENCHYDFYKCILYLQSIVVTAPFSRTEDISLENDAKITYNETVLEYKCIERHSYATKIGLPFDDPIEKFKWDTTASYYMCWYTMIGMPPLSMIGESCDNFANCFSYSGNHNHDPRANDNLPFSCAMYSFCPDPCCPMKHIESIHECRNSELNPCYLENKDLDPSQMKCQLDRKLNQNFKDIINNRWNISCNCRNGFKWASEYGMCIDLDECQLGMHECHLDSQDCLNLPGSYHCLCKWEYNLEKTATFCLKRNTSLWD